MTVGLSHLDTPRDSGFFINSTKLHYYITLLTLKYKYIYKGEM